MIFFKLEISKDEFKESGKFKIILSFNFSNFEISSPVTLSKFVFDERSSVLALIKLAFAAANDDSDWARSVRVISPFCNLALSNSTCLSNKLTFEILNFSFLFLKIKSK